MKVPLTNIEKFTKVKYDEYYNFGSVIYNEFFYMEGTEGKETTTHGSCFKDNDVIEGIEIVTDGNPYNLNFEKDNYLILVDK